jgi:superfamily II DNA or RNA helicase
MAESNEELEVGVYERPITKAVAEALARLDEKRVAIRDLSSGEAPDRVALHLRNEIERALASVPESKRVEVSVALINSVVESLVEATGRDEFADQSLNPTGQILTSVMSLDPDGQPREIQAPLISLLDTTLLTNAKRDPNVGSQLLNEIDSSASIDILVAFVRRAGVQLLLPSLRRLCERGGTVRVITTTYTGSTEKKALDQLVAIGAQVKVSYDISATRLHAKAWLFERRSGYPTAYIGSSNLTGMALNQGLEWNMRVSGARNPDVINKVRTVFDSYWQNSEFRDYDPEEFESFMEAQGSKESFSLAALMEVSPRPFQERLLELVETERKAGHHSNLIVAATGTGKTVMAAFDYKRLRAELPRARLLFVAHRKEILEQSLSVFRQVLQDFTFGELWVDGERPKHFDHVFASIQTLSNVTLADLDSQHFDVVIIDEFHHAAAASYDKLLKHLDPVELLGLTATPERADGSSVLHWFGDRIAAELRLWDAIEQGFLAPFAYFGIHDDTDLSGVTWTKGKGYDIQELTNLLTANDIWASRVIHEFVDRIDNSSTVRALGFCVSVAHAEFMATKFNKAGISATAVSGKTPSDERRKALADLRDGKIRVVFSVDVFNEGVDVPSVDAILMLRPTESATIFLQQLGRGLRKSEDKEVCTVLDFVGQHRKEFRFDLKYRALLGGTRKDLETQVREDFPFLPSGCLFRLDQKSSEIVLESLKSAIPSSWPQRVAELVALKNSGAEVSLANYLQETDLELDDVYANNRSWSDLCEAAGVETLESGPHEVALRRSIGRLLHVNDLVRLGGWRYVLTGSRPDVGGLAEREQRLLRMLLGQLFSSTGLGEVNSLESGVDSLWEHPQVRAELLEVFAVLQAKIDHVQSALDDRPDVPLLVHARYTRIEVLAAFGDGDQLQTPTWREGVKWMPHSKADVFAITFDKSGGKFSSTTSYQDYAISPDQIHWESQSTTSEKSPTGRRYQNHAEEGSDVYLFARLRDDDRSFWFCGSAKYLSHEGERPMAIKWRLLVPLPGDLFSEFAAAVA